MLEFMRKYHNVNNYITFTYLFYTWRNIYTNAELYEIKQAPIIGAFLMAWIAFDPGFFRVYIHLYGCYLLPGYMGLIRVYTAIF